MVHIVLVCRYSMNRGLNWELQEYTMIKKHTVCFGQGRWNQNKQFSYQTTGVFGRQECSELKKKMHMEFSPVKQKRHTHTNNKHVQISVSRSHK